MKNKQLFTLLSIAVIFVFITSLFSTVNVLADDNTPPVPTEEPALPPTEEPTAETESVPTSEPEAAPTETPEIDTPAEVIESAPEGVDVVVLDENGDPMSLVTEEAAQIIMAGDPQWCMEGHTPADDPAGGTFCTGKFTHFSGPGGLIEELTNFTGIDTGSGTIYVSYDYDATTAGDAGSDIIFDYSDVALTDLVVQGGWNFASNSVFGTSTINLGVGNSLEFWDWGGYGVPGSLTLRDIIITNGDGLYIGDDNDLTTANVTLDNVDVIGTEGGAYIGTDGDVIISNSKFNDTKDNDGLYVEYAGNITLTEVFATGNYGNGAFLDNSCGCVLGNIFISSSTFDSNGMGGDGVGRGLIAYSNGDMTLTNVSASGNAGGGAELKNDMGGSGSITLTGSNVFNNNGFNMAPSVGLYAVSNGNVTLSGIVASGNGLGFGGGTFVGTNNGNISITNSNFSNNCILCEIGFGLVAMGNGGDITLNAVTANNNVNDPANGYTGSALGFGALIFNMYGNTFVLNSNFNNNCALGDCLGGGIEVLSYGNVYFGNVNANGNGTTDGGGASIMTNNGDVNIYCSNFNNNTGYGLSVDSSNPITLNGVTISGNSAGDIKLSGSGMLTVNPFNCNPEPGGHKKPLPGLPINIIPVTGGFDCTIFSGTLLLLPNGDNALFPCPIQDEGRIELVSNDALPGSLPEGNEFISAFTTFLFKDGKAQETSEESIIISFMIPDGVDKEGLSILYWNGTEWTDLGGAVSADGLYFQVPTNLIGTFVLVSK